MKFFVEISKEDAPQLRKQTAIILNELIVLTPQIVPEAEVLALF